MHMCNMIPHNNQSIEATCIISQFGITINKSVNVTFDQLNCWCSYIITWIKWSIYLTIIKYQYKAKNRIFIWQVLVNSFKFKFFHANIVSQIFQKTHKKGYRLHDMFNTKLFRRTAVLREVNFSFSQTYPQKACSSIAKSTHTRTISSCIKIHSFECLLPKLHWAAKPEEQLHKNLECHNYKK